MLVEGEGSPQNNLDSFRGYLLVGSNFFSFPKLNMGKQKKYGMHVGFQIYLNVPFIDILIGYVELSFKLDRMVRGFIICIFTILLIAPLNFSSVNTLKKMHMGHTYFIKPSVCQKSFEHM